MATCAPLLPRPSAARALRFLLGAVAVVCPSSFAGADVPPPAGTVVRRAPPPPKPVYAPIPVLTVDGPLSKAVVQKTVGKQAARFRHCYDWRIIKSTVFQGMATLKFVIGKDGAVSTVTTGDSTLGNLDTITCAAGVMRNIRFPANAEGKLTIVSYPLHFEVVTTDPTDLKF